MKTKITLPLILLMLIFNHASFAESDDLKINGFLTIGGVYNNAPSNFDETLKTDGIDWSYANILGIQAKYLINEQYSLTGQLVSRGGDTDDYDIDVNWAFLSYEHSPNISLKVGRIIAPLFLISDYMDVGHAYPFPRPVKELYWQVPMNSNSGDGIEFSYKTDFGDWYLTSQTTLGKTSGKVRGRKYNIDALVINAELSNEFWKFRASYAPAKMDIDFSPLFIPVINSYLSGYGISGLLDESMENHMKMDDSGVSFSSLGLSYEDEKYLLMSEYGRTVIDKGYPEGEALYVTFGYRISGITIYSTLSKIRTYNYEKFLYNGSNALEMAAEPVINEVLLSAFTIKESAAAIGAIYYFTPSIDVKFEYKHVDTHGTNGLYDSIIEDDQKIVTLVFNAVF